MQFTGWAMADECSERLTLLMAKLDEAEVAYVKALVAIVYRARKVVAGPHWSARMRALVEAFEGLDNMED